MSRREFKLYRSNGDVVHAVEILGAPISTSHLGSQTRESIRGLSTFRLRTGESISPQGQGVFKIVETGEVLTPEPPE